MQQEAVDLDARITRLEAALRKEIERRHWEGALITVPVSVLVFLVGSALHGVTQAIVFTVGMWIAICAVRHIEWLFKPGGAYSELPGRMNDGK